ncbi:IS110 family transposase, partial [Nocardioides endophyticus]|uniref:IS110 family transposase n=1 Tax=Nocardioides endophyticus TaxID=1353775 RepID=UPI0031EAFE22
MTIVADAYTYVVGVDTHAATHHYAIIETRTGRVLDDAEFPTHAKGLLRAADWIARRTGEATGGDLDQVLISMEGTRSYGTQLAMLLAQAGYRVIDAPAPKREHGSAKNDQIDAVVAARGSLHKDLDQLPDARAGQTSATLQVLLTARNSMTTERTRAINALNALLRVHDLGIDARRKVSRPTIRTIATWRTRKNDTLALTTARAEAIRLATRILALDEEANTNERTLLTVVKDAAPTLLDLLGVGPVNAAIVLTAWSHPGRVRNEAGFAKLGGVCPLEVSSGRRHEHRLNRSGDRQLNRALHSIAKTRMQHDPTTRDYVARRTAESLSKARIRRCLKRYIARE